MSVFRTNTLASFMICVVSLFLLITMNLFTPTEVNAEEGYVMIDRGTYQVYFPEETVAIESMNNKDLKTTKELESTTKNLNSASSSGYVEPDLVVPALEENEAFQFDTYENRTTFQGIDPVDYIPINFIVDPGFNDHYYNADYYEELSGQHISILNQALNDYDPGIDTFLAIYSPDIGLLNSTFPLGTPGEITLLLNKHSYFAQGLTLDVEEWWELARYGNAKTGGPSHVSFQRSYGLIESQQETATLTHGFGVETSFEYQNQPLGVGWSAGINLSYNFADTRSYAFTRTVQASTTETFTFDFGTIAGANPYKWAVYNLVTQTKVNYSNAHNYSQLGDAFENLDDYGLRPDMNSYIVKMVNQTYATMEVPIYQVDVSLEAPQNVVANSDFRNLTTTLSWDPVTDPDVEGFIVYKNDSIDGIIFDPSRTSWIDAEVEPEKSNVYWIKSFREDFFFDTRTIFKTVSLASNTVVEEVALTSGNFGKMILGCSIPFAWEDDQIPSGERTYYRIYIGDPARGGIEVGVFEGTDASVNISPELYDVLVENRNEDFYIVKEVLYNGRLIQSPTSTMANHFTVTETAFLFSNTGFNGDCITVSKGQEINLNDNTYHFENDLSSMLVQGNIYVSLFPDLNFGGYAQTIFTEDGLANIRDLNQDTLIRQDTVSSIKVGEQKDGVYFFSGSDYGGVMTFRDNNTDGVKNYTFMNQDISTPDGLANDDLSSVKVIGPYALVVYEHSEYNGKLTVIKEDYGDPNLVNHDMDNKTSTARMFKGVGVYFFNDFDFRGDYVRVDNNLGCGYVGNCGMANDRLSSVLTIGSRGVALYEHMNYEGKVQAIRHRDNNLGSSGNVGDNKVSSFKIVGKGVYLFKDNNYDINGGYDKITSPGEYTTTDALGFQDNTLSSIFVVDMKATLFRDTNFRGTSEEFTGYDASLGDNTIGNDTVSSIIVEER
ncbi:fibronectin type III domain-containing protein [Chengkuizengella marina]|uniref:Uncharacterized protein n=1 Tax=Chengkuizengella marina TaxID=2507566 RepID=A0A6N9Q8Q5_9BACL|nr:hypothetical protein [Chengkuizengella marina]NBI31209.1 hypothetical protein [Chengkuizengella marina]